MCSPGVTLQHIYLSDPSGDDSLCWGDAGWLQVCSMVLWDFHPSSENPLAGRRQGPFCLCLPGSVTGICPCRVNECRAWLVTAPRGQTAHPNALSPPSQRRLSSDVTGSCDNSRGIVVNCAGLQRRWKYKQLLNLSPPPALTGNLVN